MKFNRLFTVSLCLLSIFLILVPEDANSLKTKTKAKAKSKPKAKATKKPTLPPFPGKKSDSTQISLRILRIPGSNQTEEILVDIPEHGELIIGKDVPEKNKLILQCAAPFPVQWIYSGDGIPSISTNSSTISSQRFRLGKAFMANAELGYDNKLKETDTGEYICKKVQDGQNVEDEVSHFKSIYIYVPGKSLFIQKSGDTLYHSGDASRLRIPCSVTHPKASVALQRNDNGFLQCPMGGEITYSPQSGFLLSPLNKRKSYLFGSYVCIGYLNGTTQHGQFVEYKVLERRRRREEKVPLSLIGSGNLHVHVKNLQDEVESYDEIFPRETPSSCFPSNPCGPNSMCIPTPGKSFPRCFCRFGVGRPPKCRPECNLHMDCPSGNLCFEGKCVDPCETMICGEGAKCVVKNLEAKCTCPEGYIGNAGKGGKCGRNRTPSVQYFPLGNGVSFSMNYAEEQVGKRNKFPCDPWPCGPNSECKPVEQNAHCRCAKGFIGIPPNCRAECNKNRDCPEDLFCFEGKCKDPCFHHNVKCGVGANCMTYKHSANCYCKPGLHGNAFVKCQEQPSGLHQKPIPAPRPPTTLFPESPDSSEEETHNHNNKPNRPIHVVSIPSGTMRPVGNGNEDNEYPGTPCANSPCGQNAICSFRNSTVGCKCPSSFNGFGSDPYVECYPSSNPCEVCGPHSQCIVKPGRQPICKCLAASVGTPPNCRERGSCVRNSECQDDQYCNQNGACDNPCKRADCTRLHAVCIPKRHLAVCACRNAPDRDPLFGCPPPTTFIHQL